MHHQVSRLFTQVVRSPSRSRASFMGGQGSRPLRIGEIASFYPGWSRSQASSYASSSSQPLTMVRKGRRSLPPYRRDRRLSPCRGGRWLIVYCELSNLPGSLFFSDGNRSLHQGRQVTASFSRSLASSSRSPNCKKNDCWFLHRDH